MSFRKNTLREKNMDQSLIPTAHMSLRSTEKLLEVCRLTEKRCPKS